MYTEAVVTSLNRLYLARRKLQPLVIWSWELSMFTGAPVLWSWLDCHEVMIALTRSVLLFKNKEKK